MQPKAWFAIVALGLCAPGLVMGVSAQGKSKPPANVLVQSTVHDFNGPDTMLLQSDGVETYSNGAGVVGQIWAGNGDWDLDLSEQSLRTVRLTLSAVPGSPVSPVPSTLYNAKVLSRCFDALENITGFLQIGEGQSNSHCSLRVTFNAGGVQHFLVMSPLYNEFGTGSATVSCDADSDANTTCERWTIVPGPGPNATVAALFSLGRGNKAAFVGNYFTTFRIVVSR